MALVCIDNHILVWGIRKTATPGQEGMIERATQLLEELDEKRIRVIVPAPVVAEFLTGTAESEHARVLQTFQEKFILAPFDALAALVTARARRKNLQSGLEKTIREELSSVARPQGAVDHMILGIALANKVDLLYTAAAALRKFAEPHITLRGIPTIGKQLGLPQP